jgi:choline dehydrogenase-like flavoprotein
MVSRVVIGHDGRSIGVTYLRGGVEYMQRARLVVVSAYSIETPRLLLNSACSRFPEGLCNDHDQVGRYVMVQGAPQTAGRYEEEIRAYKAPPPEVSTEEFYEDDPANDYRRGFSLQCVSPLPMTFAEHVSAQRHWGDVLRTYMMDYVHWATFGALCELLPQPGNRVTLSDENDRHGLPVARFDYTQCENDKKLIKAATQMMEDMHKAAGADEAITIQRYAHLIGGCRMAASAADGVVDRNSRTFAVENLYIVDGSVFPTQGAANPALTVMAVAARAADHLSSANRGYS